MKKRILLLLALILCISLSACDEANTPTDPETEPHTHDFGEWEVSVKPSCIAPGKEIRTCDCGEEETRELDMIQHKYGRWEISLAPTCTQKGEEAKTCVCGKQVTRSVNATGHHHKESDRVEPGLTTPGSITYTCPDCKDSYTKELEPLQSEGLEYKISDTLCRITGIGTCKDKVLYIPEEIEGCPVLIIEENAFYDCDQLTDVIIPDSVFNINDYAFAECENLKSVKLPNNDEIVFGRGVFKRCVSLNNVTIPGCVYKISDEMFCDCYSLTKITIEEGVMRIGFYAFDSCPFTSITLPDSLVHIEFGAFFCTNLKKVDIPRGIQIIEYGAFHWCSEITEFTFPEGITEVPDQILYNCSSLTSVTIPASVTRIGEWAFMDCPKLKEIHFGGTMEQWNAIEKCWVWNENTGYYTVYCSDGEISK